MMIPNLLTLFAADSAQAQQNAECLAKSGGKLLGIIPRWYEYLDFDSACNLTVNFQDNPESLWGIGFAIIEILLRVGGIIAFCFIIYGGFLFVTSQGDPEGIKKARTTVLNAVIGVAISILASSIVIFIAGKF